jgi:CheY-like chemotaxis protein
VIDEQQLAGLRILVVDDDLDTRDGLAQMLSLRGALITVAASAQEGMAEVEKLPPDVLVCDVAMPGEDGYTFIRRLRALQPAQGRDIPALALTGLRGEDDRSDALTAGFHLHLTKPIEVDRLLEAIAALRASEVHHV